MLPQYLFNNYYIDYMGKNRMEQFAPCPVLKKPN